jgi:hypothetical protein
MGRGMAKVLPKATVDKTAFNAQATLPYNLRLSDFEGAMNDIYDFFHDTNSFLVNHSLPRLDDTLRKAIMSGVISDMLTDALAKHARNLVRNAFHNGHPDLLVGGVYPNNATKSGTDGVEIKTTKKKGGAVDTHGGRDQTMCVFVYEVDHDPAKAVDARQPMTFREVYLAKVLTTDFRNNARGKLGTRTSTLDKAGVLKLRNGWIYKKP